MGRTVERATIEGMWPALLLLRERLQSPESRDATALYVCKRDGAWTVAPAGSGVLDGASDVLVLPLSDAKTRSETPSSNGQRRARFGLARGDATTPRFVALQPASTPAEAELTAWRLYLPLLLEAHRARRAGRSFVLAHYAQTLDGRIACGNGSSRWIGNTADQEHAHRLRALCDAVLVGSRTVELDDPQLTVRHVRGPDPARVVLSASGRLLHGSTGRRIFEGAGATMVTSSSAASRLPARLPAGARVIALDSGPDAELLADRICAALRANGITSLFVEGGARTLSSFLRQGAIDLLQIHIAPRILGSGLGAFALPEVGSMGESRRFHMESFTLDGELLVECRARTG